MYDDFWEQVKRHRRASLLLIQLLLFLKKLLIRLSVTWLETLYYIKNVRCSDYEFIR